MLNYHQIANKKLLQKPVYAIISRKVFFLSVMHILKHTLVVPFAELKCCLLVNYTHSFATEQCRKFIKRQFDPCNKWQT